MATNGQIMEVFSCTISPVFCFNIIIVPGRSVDSNFTQDDFQKAAEHRQYKLLSFGEYRCRILLA